MCKYDEETISHLLIHCEVVHDLWSLILHLFKVEWVLSQKVEELLYSCGGARVGRRRKLGTWFLWWLRGWFGLNQIEEPLMERRNLFA